MSAVVHLCPSCRQPAQCVVGHQIIRSHVDTLGLRECPSSREPFYTTVIADAEVQLHAMRSTAA